MWWMYKIAGFNSSSQGNNYYWALSENDWQSISLINPINQSIKALYDVTTHVNDYNPGMFLTVATSHVNLWADVLWLVCLSPVVAWTWHVCEELSAVEHFSQWALQDLIDHTLLHVHQHRLWIQISEYEASTYISWLLYAEHMPMTPFHHSKTPLCNLNQWLPNLSLHRLQPWPWPWL